MAAGRGRPRAGGVGVVRGGRGVRAAPRPGQHRVGPVLGRDGRPAGGTAARARLRGRNRATAGGAPMDAPAALVRRPRRRDRSRAPQVPRDARPEPRRRRTARLVAQQHQPARLRHLRQRRRRARPVPRLLRRGDRGARRRPGPGADNARAGRCTRDVGHPSRQRPRRAMVAAAGPHAARRRGCGPRRVRDHTARSRGGRSASRRAPVLPRPVRQRRPGRRGASGRRRAEARCSRSRLRLGPARRAGRARPSPRRRSTGPGSVQTFARPR